MRLAFGLSVSLWIVGCRAQGLAAPPDAQDATNPDAPIGKTQPRRAIDASAFDDVKLGSDAHSGHKMHGHAGHKMPAKDTPDAPEPASNDQPDDQAKAPQHDHAGAQ